MPKLKTPPPTLEEVAERKVRERLTAYREFVSRAASGEQLLEADFDAVSDLLDRLGLAPFTFKRDVQAQTEYAATLKAEGEARAKRPAEGERLKALNDRLKALEDEAATLRAERHRLGPVTDNLLVFYGSRRRELEAEHPHALAPLEEAVRFRLEQQRKRPAMTMSLGSAP